jgi:MFS family permease
MSIYVRLLRANRGYALLWLAQVVSLAGDWFNTIALSTLVVAYSPGREGAAISGFLLARFIPPMLISPFAGVLIDRFDRKTLLIWSNLLRAVTVCGFLLTTQGADWLPVIYILTIIQFSLSAVFEPGQSAYLPSLLHPDDLVTGNTLVSVTWSVMLAVGAMLGGAVASVFGTNAALVIDALSFLIAALVIIPVKPRPDAVARPLTSTGTREQVTFSDGLRFLRAHPEISSTLLVKFGNSIGNVDTLMPIYATQLFILGSGGQLSLGIMYGVFGVGAFISPFIANRFMDGSVRALRRSIFVGLLCCTAGWVLLGAAGSLIGVCVALFVRAMGGSLNWTYSNVIYQKTTPDHYLGRVFSLDAAGFYLATVISTLIHGTLIDAVGAANIGSVALGTGVVSLAPLIAWTAILRWTARVRSQPTFN